MSDNGELYEYFDIHVLIYNLQRISAHTLLNQGQKNKFIEAEVFRSMLLLNEEDLPALRASWKGSQ
jgi:hypothetical protein